jgi:polyferredoxin
MNDSSIRFIFAGLCILGLVTIWCGVGFEGRRQQRTPTISKRHFRWRLVSAGLWTLILGSLAYGTLFSWPTPGDLVTARRFGAIVAGSFALIFLALIVVAFDFYLTAQTRRIQTARMHQNMDEMARIEIERAQQAKRDAEGGDSI